jgi:hypothetical protein
MDDVWFFLYENPTKTKDEAYYELKLGWDRNSCPCCEYAYQQTKGNMDIKMCCFCPLKDYWPEGGCMAKESAYLEWSETDDLEVKANAAAEICCVANMKYFELKDKEV